MNPVVQRLKKQFAGKKVLVVGLGFQGGGAGLTDFFLNLGSLVTVTDLKSKEVLSPMVDLFKGKSVVFHLGKHEQKDFLEADYIFIGPSVRWSLPELQNALKNGVPVEMEASFFVKNCPAVIVGVTGTRGKSTTTEMIYTALLAQGKSVYRAGNVPNISTIKLLDRLTEKDIVILELSSWQLSSFHRDKISPKIAVVTNLFPDHLNYYSTIDSYWQDKTAIFQYQQPGNTLIANYSLRERIEGLKTLGKKIYFQASDFPADLVHINGTHNRENAAAALFTLRTLGLPDQESVSLIQKFHGLPYRQEIIGEKNNVLFVNDTTSTTPTATIRAINTFEKNPIVLIMGGNSKNLPTESLLSDLERAEKIILLPGTFTTEISPRLKTMSNVIQPVFFDLKTAVEYAYSEAQAIASRIKKKTIVLFSPSATSFSQFRNEFHRGEVFNEIVKSLISS